MARTRVLVPILFAALALAGCGDDQTEAVQSFCDARQDAETALTNLRNFDPATESVEDVQSERDDLRSAVEDLVEARSDLDGEVVDSVQQSWDELAGQIQDLSDVPVAEAGPEAKANVESAVQAFRTSWTQAVQDADC